MNSDNIFFSTLQIASFQICNSGIQTKIKDFLEAKHDVNLKKQGGGKRSKLRGLAKLEDANHAGTK